MRNFLIVLIASLTISALLGVWVLLVGEIGDVESRILITTLSFGGFSVTGLAASVRLDRRRFVPVGVGGLIASGVALVLSLTAIWARIGDSQVFFQLLGTSVVIAVALAYASLVLLVKPAHGAVAAVVAMTEIFAGVIAASIIGIIWADTDPPELMARGLGALAILAVLGTLVAPILNRVLRTSGDKGAPSAA
jgi:hypothetical protein